MFSFHCEASCVTNCDQDTSCVPFDAFGLSIVSGMSQLRSAAANGDVGAIQRLVAQGTNVDARDGVSIFQTLVSSMRL